MDLIICVVNEDCKKLSHYSQALLLRTHFSCYVVRIRILIAKRQQFIFIAKTRTSLNLNDDYNMDLSIGNV